MSVIESVKGIMWARRRQPDEVVYGISLAHERFGPRELLDQAVAVERAGFDLPERVRGHVRPGWWTARSGAGGL